MIQHTHSLIGRVPVEDVISQSHSFWEELAFKMDTDTMALAIYIDNILTKLTTIGALYLTLVCLMPEFLIANYPIPFYLGGTSILIVVVVAIDTVTQIQTRLMSSQYEQLIKKTKFGR